MLSKLTKQHKPHSSLYLPSSNSWLLVGPSKPRSLLSQLLENVVDEAAHDPHGFARDPDIRAHLLQSLEDVDLVCLYALLGSLLLLICSAALLGQFLICRWSLLRFLSRFLLGWLLLCFWRHQERLNFWDFACL